MSLYYSSLLAVFAVIAVMIAVDPNVGVFIELQIKSFFVFLKRMWYLVTIGVTVRYNNWQIMRQVKKIRKERGLPDG